MKVRAWIDGIESDYSRHTMRGQKIKIYALLTIPELDRIAPCTNEGFEIEIPEKLAKASEQLTALLAMQSGRFDSYSLTALRVILEGLKAAGQ